MNKLYISLTLLAAVFYSFSALALKLDTPHESASFYEHMLEVNAEWNHLPVENYTAEVNFKNKEERIQAHLVNVIDYLNNYQPLGFTDEVIAKRRQLLEELSAYADAQVFPMNIYHNERTPYFIDHRGVHCAVGYLILKSGNGELAQTISSEHNYDYIKEITTNGLTEWASEHGFSVDELKWIQPSYPPAQQMAAVGQGTNGPVTVMSRFSNEGLVIAGEFTELDGLECLNIGIYDGEALSCLGNGIEGIVSDVLMNSSGVYAVGELVFEGDIYPLAVFENGNWEHINLPEFEGYTGTAIGNGISILVSGDIVTYRAEVVVQNLEVSDDSHVFWYNSTGEWELQFSVNGKINDIHVSGAFERAYGGDFNSVVYENENYETQNVVIYKPSIYEDENIEVFNGAICPEVNTIEKVGDKYFFGGFCGTENQEPEVCLTSYLNGISQPVFINSNSLDYEIRSILYDNNTRLLLGGDFYAGPEAGLISGENLGVFDFVSNYIFPLAATDSGVNAIEYFSGEYYVGGDFSFNLDLELNHLAKITDSSNTLKEQSKISFKAYPNPASNTLNIQLENRKEATIELISITGQTVLSETFDGTPTGSVQLNVSDLTRGFYYLRVDQLGDITTIKVVLE